MRDHPGGAAYSSGAVTAQRAGDLPGRRDQRGTEIVRVIVIGAGIGGLTAALSLEAAGIDVVVVESAQRLRSTGVGINLQPHAVRELTELGLGRRLEASGVQTSEMVHFDRHGNRIWSEPRGRALGYHWSQYSIHRGELQMILLDAVRDRLDPAALRLGIRFDGVDELATSVRAHVTDRRTGRSDVVTGDVLIGADGINSVVRAQLHPTQPPLHFDGIRMWRGVTEAAPFLTGRSMVVAGTNSAAKFVAYPISGEAERRGRALVNWVAEVRQTVAEHDAEPDWTRTGRAVDVLPYFGDWKYDWVDIPDLILRADSVLEYPMVDRDPLTWWGRERVNLLGDAAHPMYPIGSNGGSQAIIDARVLAYELATADDASQGLRAYEMRRRDLTNDLVLANRSMPAERVLQTVAERAPDGFDQIEDVLDPEELDTVRHAYRQTTSVDVQALNNQSSLTPTLEGSLPEPVATG